ncbi:MAG: phage terminase large subunit family protein, partial [Magnetococcales bacterium]|nr:phage terminase large subunit family protein [Magnetococcales bacterium]
DTGGHRSMEAYTFCRTRQERRIWAIKGLGGMGKPIWPSRSSRNNKGRVPHFMVGVDAAKESIYSRLRLKEPGPGYCHFPLDRDAEWFRQLTAEKITTRYNKGRPIREWVKKSHDRNEALDCRVYAMAALHGLISMGLQLSKEADQREQYPLKEGQPPPEPVAHVAVQIIVPKKLKIIMPDKPRKSSWLGPLRDRWINGGR